VSCRIGTDPSFFSISPSNGRPRSPSSLPSPSESSPSRTLPTSSARRLQSSRAPTSSSSAIQSSSPTSTGLICTSHTSVHVSLADALVTVGSSAPVLEESIKIPTQVGSSVPASRRVSQRSPPNSPVCKIPSRAVAPSLPPSTPAARLDRATRRSWKSPLVVSRDRRTSRLRSVPNSKVER
jgi:hypothetical protein